MLNPYPSDLVEAASILYRKLKGEDVPLNEAIHAAYQIEGVCLSHIYGTEGVTPAQSPRKLTVNTDISDEQGMAALERVTSSQQAVGPVAGALLQELLGIAVKKLSEWLSGKLKTT